MEVIMSGNISKSNRIKYSQFIISSLLSHTDQLSENLTRVIDKTEFDFNMFEYMARRNKVLLRSSKKIFESGILPNFKKQFSDIIKKEHNRLDYNLNVLNSIHKKFELENINFTVMKTLDNVPDIGNDIDLIVLKDDIDKANIILENDFGGIPKLELSKTPGETKSVCDKLVGKRLYYCQKFESSNEGLIPQVEIYPGFSQLGEEYIQTSDIIKLRKSVMINNFKFFIPSVEHRLLISCTHGLFRHGVIRISELHNSLNWFNEKIDWDLLDHCIKKSGVVYSFKIFLNHIFKYSQIKGVEFPIEINHFLDINQHSTNFNYPFKPNTTSFALLWIKKGINDFKNGKINSGCRSLFLSPILASIALSKYKLTGKTGIW
jgi:hypothetical protein